MCVKYLFILQFNYILSKWTWNLTRFTDYTRKFCNKETENGFEKDKRGWDEQGNSLLIYSQIEITSGSDGNPSPSRTLSRWQLIDWFEFCITEELSK